MSHHTSKIVVLVFVVAFFTTFAGNLIRNIYKRRNATSFDVWDKYNGALKRQIQAIIFAVAGVGILWCAVWLDKHGTAILTWIVGKLGSRTVKYWITMTVLATGAAAYYFKKKNQAKYGFIEVMFGLAATIIALQHVETDKVFPTVATLGGCIYIIARGITNFVEGEAAKKPTGSELERLEAALDWQHKYIARTTARPLAKAK